MEVIVAGKDHTAPGKQEAPHIHGAYREHIKSK